MIEYDSTAEGPENESRLRASQSGNVQRDNRRARVISRRTLLLGSAGTALAGLAGCNRLPIDEFADTRFSPQPPPTSPTPITETPVTSNDVVPEDFEDGCGKVGPGETVAGTREGIEFRISPIGDQPTATAKGAPDVALESVEPPIIGRSRRIAALDGLQLSTPVTLQTRQSDACTQETKQAVRKSARTLTLVPESSRIYPGALVRLDSVWKGQMQPVIGDRAPIRISISLPATQFEGSAVRVVSSPSLSAVRDAVNDLLRTVIGGTATRADVTYDMHSVYDWRQGHVDIGAHFDGFVYDFGFDFEAEKEGERSKVVVVFRQNYFTVDVDIPNAFFADGRNPSRQDAIVSSVTYGRLLLFSAESDASEERTKAALNAALLGLGRASAGGGHEEVIREMTLRVRALGGLRISSNRNNQERS
ncbi:thiol-activated cytolysin family protein [Salinigranum halophilum]|uniref:thiol-activated cytolysin family protein n=1 Tax=Salinigranum halophilum TaxID=2565931 RepID=UPI0022AA6C2C|nr:thiol-activated cytolysin family protein [Salinigranum halophilum]